MSCVKMVWIESTMTSDGEISFVLFTIDSSSVSGRIRTFLLFTPRRSPRSFICAGDSSPETYNTLPDFAIDPATCKSSVDFPIPGSPPINVIDPGTIPPPRVLSSSPIPVGRRMAFCGPTSQIDITFDESEFSTHRLLLPALDLFSVFVSSTKLPHSSHDGHLPSHLPELYPHDLQAKVTEFLANLLLWLLGRDSYFCHISRQLFRVFRLDLIELVPDKPKPVACDY